MAMDDAITTTLEGIYGEVPSAFHNAVSSEVETILRTLQAEAPEKWEQIRRSETYQKRLVAHCAQKLVPPKAREIVMDKHEKERPTTYADIMQARSEIRQLKQAMSQGHDVGYTPKQLESFERQVREQEWEMRYNGVKRYNQGRRA
jgi:GTP1/Obg family GTP-binding protein